MIGFFYVRVYVYSTIIKNKQLIFCKIYARNYNEGLFLIKFSFYNSRLYYFWKSHLFILILFIKFKDKNIYNIILGTRDYKWTHVLIKIKVIIIKQCVFCFAIFEIVIELNANIKNITT